MHCVLAALFSFAFTLRGMACELALVLAVDVSGSVDPLEYDIQMQGLAAALQDSIVSEALVRAEANLLLLQWTGSTRQAVSLPWRQIESFDDVAQFAADVAEAPRVWRNFSTAIGEALGVALQQFDTVPECRRRVIDVSGEDHRMKGSCLSACTPRWRPQGSR